MTKTTLTEIAIETDTHVVLKVTHTHINKIYTGTLENCLQFNEKKKKEDPESFYITRSLSRAAFEMATFTKF